MKNRNPRRAILLQMSIAWLLMAGCQSTSQPGPVKENAGSEAAAAQDENQRVAEAALGKQAKILAQGDLARNGLKQLLVVNPLAIETKDETGDGNSRAIRITRAVVVEKNNNKWTEMLRCDEHLKNTNGYLGGSPAVRVTGWRVEFNEDTKQGLEMRFTPTVNGSSEEGASVGEVTNRTVVVRWNPGTKRYQSLDQDRQGYLSEIPTLETPTSILK